MKKATGALTLLIATLLAALALTGCSGGKKTLDIDAFTAQALKTAAYDDQMVALTEKTAPDFYNLSFEGLEKYTIYVSGTMATANELAVMQLRDEKAIEAAKLAVGARIKDQTANYESYRPEELFRIQNSVVVVKGNYLLFSVGDQNDAIQKLFTESFK